MQARTAGGLLAASSLREQGRSGALPTGWKQQGELGHLIEGPPDLYTSRRDS